MFAASKIIVADDHPLFRSALRQAIDQTFTSVQIIECDSIASLEKLCVEHVDADLVLLDLHMPGAVGYSGLVLIRRQFPDLPVVVISASEDISVMHRSIDYGASGFIPKSSPLTTISEALQAVLSGSIWLPEGAKDADANISSDEQIFASRVKTLTPQQFRVYLMLTKGLLNKQIADEVSVSEATIRTHMTAIFKKLGVRNRTQAVLAAQYLSVDDKTVS